MGYTKETVLFIILFTAERSQCQRVIWLWLGAGGLLALQHLYFGRASFRHASRNHLAAELRRQVSIAPRSLRTARRSVLAKICCRVNFLDGHTAAAICFATVLGAGEGRSILPGVFWHFCAQLEVKSQSYPLVASVPHPSRGSHASPPD